MKLADLNKRVLYVSASRKEGLRLLYYGIVLKSWSSHRLYTTVTKTEFSSYLRTQRRYHSSTIVALSLVDMTRLKNESRVGLL